MENQNCEILKDAIQNIDKPVIPAKKEKKAVNWREKMQEKMAPLLSFKCILPGSDQEIEYTSMNTKDLKRLLMFGATSDPRLIEDALDGLISSVVVTPDFNVEDLIIYDRIYLLVSIRINSKGGSIESSYTCQECGNQVLFTQNLADFGVEEKPKNISHEIPVTNGFSLIIDYNTRRDQKEMFKFSKAIVENEKRTELGLLNLAGLIKGVIVDGEKHIFPDFTYEDRYNTLMDLPESILDKIIKWEKTNAFGVQMSYERVCPHCGAIENITIPITSLF